VFSIWEDGYIKLVDLKTNTTKDLVYTFDVKSVRDLAACDLPFTKSISVQWPASFLGKLEALSGHEIYSRQV
jgi:hypothetical protein